MKRHLRTLRSLGLATLLLALALLAGCGDEPATSEPINTPGPAQSLASPGQVQIQAGNGQVTLGWDYVSGAAGYTLYWSTRPGVSPQNGNTLPATTNPYVHTGLANGTTYYYVVTAWAMSGASSTASAEVSATPMPPLPGVPGGVSAQAGTQQVTVRWNSVGGATGYALYWATSPGVTKANGNRISGVVSPFVHSGLSGGTRYYYAVAASNLAGEGNLSAEVGAVPQAPPSTSSVDQQQLEIDTSAGTVLAIGGASEQKLAQVVTPGITGRLSEVRFPVGCAGDLIVRIATVTDGVPTATILAETVLPGAQVGGYANPPVFKSLVLSSPLPVVAGEPFAIILDSPGSCSVYPGPVGDPYPGGNGYFDSRPNPSGEWAPLSYGRNDLPFQTVVAADAPTEPSQLAGLWSNVTYTGHTAQIELRQWTDPAGQERWAVHGWGFCGGGLCDWGEVPATRLANGEVNGKWDFGWKTTEVRARMSASQPGHLETDMWNDYADWDGRTDFGITETYNRVR